MEKKCPYCAETIKAEAIKCRYCSSDLSHTVPASAEAGSPASVTESGQGQRKSFPAADEMALRYDAQKKSAGVGYFLWFILGSFGGHRYYFGRTGSAVCMTLGALSSLLIALAGADSGVAMLGMVILAAIVLCVLVDAFLIPGWTNEFNSNLVNALKKNPAGTNQGAGSKKAVSTMPSQPISISICPECRAQGEGSDEACGRCGHVYA